MYSGGVVFWFVSFGMPVQYLSFQESFLHHFFNDIANYQGAKEHLHVSQDIKNSFLYAMTF